MKIVIVVAGSSGHLSGVTRHAANLARCLLSRGGVTAIHVVAAECQWDALDSALPHNDARLHLHEISMGSNAISRNLWYYNHLPAIARRLKADIVHFAYPAPVNRQALGLPEDRRHERIAPHYSRTTLKTSDGREYAAKLIDISISGAAMNVEASPPIGAPVTVGQTPAQVVRHFVGGIAVEFTRLLSQETFGEDTKL